MLRTCRKCHHLFMPRAGEQMCGVCDPHREPFKRDPIDLWLQWAERD